MILYGASGHCKVILDCLELSKEERIILVDDDINKTYFLNRKVINNYAELTNYIDKVIISIGDNLLRKKINSKLTHELGRVVSSSSIISKNSNIGLGTVVFNGSVIQTETLIGNNVIINTASSVDHECYIEDYVHISPNSTICGNVKIGEGTHIGAGSTILPNLKIGKWCRIGAGSVVINDIPDYSTVVGVPGKVIKINNIKV